MEIANSWSWWTFRFHARGCTPSYQARKGLQTRSLKIDPDKCFHLKYPYNSYIFKSYQKHYFYAGYIKQKIENVLTFFKKKL